jgi:hypothetical protein
VNMYLAIPKLQLDQPPVYMPYDKRFPLTTNIGQGDKPCHQN